jgi:methionyl-tRNA formyltransferase
MKIVFWGNSLFSMPSLAMLFQYHEIAAVVTNPDAKCGRGYQESRMTLVKEFALKNQLPVFQPCDLKDESFFVEVSRIKPDFFIVVSYGMILPEKMLSLPKYHSFNLHASLLPKYRGASPIQTALLNGDKETGNTVQLMSKKMDAGDIVLQRKTAILPEDNYQSLSEKLAREGASLLKEAIELTLKSPGNGTPQNENEATYTKLIKKEDGRVSFVENTAEQIYNKGRAFSEWPGIFSYQGGNPVYFTEIQKISTPGKASPGEIVQADKKALTVACKEDIISILKLKPAGKKEMDFVSFINGYKPVVGKLF